jgi:anti-sigma factor RsiW
VFAMLSDYLNLELPADACDQIRQHLADCPPCVEFAESLRKTVDLCRAYEPDVIPKPLTAEARSELEQAWRKMLAARAAQST